MAASGIIRDLLQAKLELQDDQALEQFWFIDDRHVAATIGTKGGSVCGPVLYYRITSDDAVEICDDGGEVWFRWEQLHLEGETLRILCQGRPRELLVARLPDAHRD
jgi:hypothetical protein